MNQVNLCVSGLQHCWVAPPRDMGLQFYSCPLCGQLVYWGDAILRWGKPGTSGGEPIPGNTPTKPTKET